MTCPQTSPQNLPSIEEISKSYYNIQMRSYKLTRIKHQNKKKVTNCDEIVFVLYIILMYKHTFLSYSYIKTVFCLCSCCFFMILFVAFTFHICLIWIFEHFQLKVMEGCWGFVEQNGVWQIYYRSSITRAGPLCYFTVRWSIRSN